MSKPFHRISSFFQWKNWKYILLLMTLMIMSLFLLALYLPLPSAQMPLASEVIDVNHQPVTTFYLQNRRPVKLSEVPDFMIKAILAMEDHRFYEHHGINPGRILKAAWYDLVHRRLAQGASTITQQLAKNTYLTHQRTFSRKIKELFYTLKLELHLSKDQILELYLNQIYFGHGAYGIKIAAETYFQKNINQLNPAEMALLAGLPKGPGYYSPYINLNAARKRLSQTLKRMVECHYISPEEAATYQQLPLSLPGLKASHQPAPYYLDLLQDEVSRLFPKEPGIIYTGGLRIESTLDLKIQSLAEKAISNGLPRLTRDKQGLIQPQAALITIDPYSGEIRALIGGTDYQKSQFNRAVQAKRQPGSAFKPILYATALSNGYTLTSLFDRTPKTYVTGTTPYRPLDGQDDTKTGFLTLREALACSSNVVAVKLLEAVGIDKVIQFATKLGISSKLPPLLSLALGSGEMTPLELTTAYIPLANGGFKVRPTTIRRILDRNGKVIYQAPIQKEPVISSGVSFLLTHALTGVLEEGGTAFNIRQIYNHPAAGKTGTTDHNRDAWFIGYTPELLTGVFVGCDRNERSLPGAANRIAAPIWANLMKQIPLSQPEKNFIVPNDIVELKICQETGAKATPYCPWRTEYFIVGTEPTEFCPEHRYVHFQVCQLSGLLPGPYCNNLEEQEFHLGEQPTAICDQCHPDIFDWFRRFLKPRRRRRL